MVISGIWVSFLVIAYAGLIVTIPRAGGDYVWQTRILGSGIGFVMAATGLVVHPLAVGADLRQHPVGPVLPADLGHARWTWPGGGYAWFGTENGVFIVADHDRDRRLPGLARDGRLRADPEVVLHRRPDRLRRVVGAAAVQLARRASSARSTTRSSKLFGVNNAYAADERGSGEGRLQHHAFGFGPLAPTMLLVPADDVLHPVAELGHHADGEIRGASDFQRVLQAACSSACGSP